MDRVKLHLPKERSIPAQNLADYSQLWFGDKKIGKTTLAAQFPKAIFFCFEPGGKALSIYKIPTEENERLDWETFKRYIRMLEKSKRFLNIIIDTADLAYRACEKYVCEKLAIDHPSEEDWGKGWGALRDEFTTVFMHLISGSRGVIFISHASEKTIKKKNGKEETRIVSTLPESARAILEGMVDIWFYYTYDAEGNRIMQIRGDGLASCGHRLRENFLGLDEIPMGHSEEEGYRNLLGAFNNTKPWKKGGMTQRRKIVVVR